MILDAGLSFVVVTGSNHVAQAETSATTHISDNVIDTTRIPRTIIENGYFVFDIEVAITSGSGTLDIQLVTSAAEALTAPTIEWSSGVLSNTVIEAWEANSNIFAFKIPARMHLRYLGVNYVIAADTFSTGSWRSYITLNAPYRLPATP